MALWRAASSAAPPLLYAVIRRTVRRGATCRRVICAGRVPCGQHGSAQHAAETRVPAWRCRTTHDESRANRREPSARVAAYTCTIQNSTI